jgi:hypothetical protein
VPTVLEQLSIGGYPYCLTRRSRAVLTWLYEVKLDGYRLQGTKSASSPLHVRTWFHHAGDARQLLRESVSLIRHAPVIELT